MRRVFVSWRWSGLTSTGEGAESGRNGFTSMQMAGAVEEECPHCAAHSAV